MRRETPVRHSGRVPLVYVTGISGSGKSAVCAELNRRGYEAHDTDRDENAVWVNRTTGEVTAVAGAADRSRPGWLLDQEWRVVPSKVQALAGRADERLVFLCGSTANEDEVWHLFARVIYLAIDEQTLRDRLASRTSNDFGKAPEELEAILAWHEVGDADYLRFGAVIVDASLPLHHVVDRVLEAAS
jgi:broad-specificity NMP kinase